MKNDKQTAVRIDRDLYAKVKALAEKERRPISSQIAIMLEAFLAGEPKR